MLKRFLFGLVVLSVISLAQAAEIFSMGSTWKYLLGTQEASNPIDAWRAVAFDDSAWSVGQAPVGYGEANIQTQIPSTAAEGWLCVFFRKTFVISSPADISELDFSVLIDDGYAVWLNGYRVGQYNVPEGDLTFDTPDWNPLPQGPIEPTMTAFTVTQGLASILLAGTNVVAIQAFNANHGSSDLVVDASLSGVVDTAPPLVAGLIPPANALVRQLSQIEVKFSEGVAGVDAADLLINGQAATNLLVVSPEQYVFTFPEPATGRVQVAWSATHGIHDLAAAANPFAGGSWAYELDPNTPVPALFISEFMASNRHGLHDEDGDNSDWIELFNPGDAATSLAGWSLTTRSDGLSEWRIPAVTLLPKAYLVIFASGKDRTNATVPLHTNFRLEKEGGYLALIGPDGKVVSDFAPGYPPQQTDVSYGRDAANPRVVGFFLTPTPGKANSTSGPGFAPEVHFAFPSRTFSSPFNLELSAASTNAVIHYTLDASLPTEASSIYTKPLAIGRTTLVRTRAFEPGLLPGPFRSETFFQLSPELLTFNSDLPVVVLHNLGGGFVPASQDQFVAVQVFEPRTGPSSLTNLPDLAIQGIFHTRGRSTGGLPKASFFLETQDELGADAEVSLAGLPSESDWVLYAPNGFEPVLIHNPMAHELMRQMGRYSPRTRLCEVYLKDDGGTPGPLTDNDYNGVYVIEEKIKIGKNRVDIDKLQPEQTAPPQVTGGYLFSIDSPPPGTSPFYGAGASINYLEPSYFELNTAQRSAQKKYVTDYFSAFGNSLIGPNWNNPTNGYAAYIDVDAAIDHQMQGVVTFNVDALRLSGYFYKPRNGKITMGPVWDFDRTQGSTDGRDFNPRVWRSAVPDYGTDMFNSDPIFNNPWYSKMFRDIDFWQKWIDRYELLRQGPLRTAQVYATIDSLAARLRQAQPREQQRWGNYPRSGNWGSGGYSYRFPGTYQGEVTFMQLWYSNRLDFLDGQFLAAPSLSHASGPITPTDPITLTGPAGATIYYTVDGTDPRLPGGNLSPAAQTYSVPLHFPSNTRLTARCQDLNHKNLTGANKPPLSSTWSGVTAATFVVGTPTLVITKIMYHPASLSGGTNDADSFEYLELRNVGDATLNLKGFRFTQGVEFQFPDLNLAAGERVLVVKDPSAFQARYGTNALVAGSYTGQLDNAGERLVLEGPVGETLLDFSYNNSWYPITDGLGFALVIRNDHAAVGGWDSKSNWRPSAAIGGAPGTIDPAPPEFPAVVVNEALAYPDAGQQDPIELFNAGSAPADISGWLLSDDFSQPYKFRIPAGTVIPEGGYKVFTAADFSRDLPTSFRLRATGDEVYLFSADANTNLTGYLHGYHFEASDIGVSFGRYLNSVGEEQFVAQERLSLGRRNAAPKVGPAVINEIMYQPRTIYGTNNNTRDEYIELHNLSGQSLALSDPDQPTNTWRLRGGVSYDFPQGTTLPPTGYLLVVGFDPAVRTADLAAFRVQYGLAGDTMILGPWSGQLENSGENIKLEKPQAFGGADASVTNGTVHYILADEIDYSETTPWPTNASGTGNSLQRIDSATYGNEPLNWRAAAPTPGQQNPGTPIDSDNDGLPDIWERTFGLDPQDSTGNHGATGDPDGDRMTNLQENLSGTDPLDAASYLRVESIQVGAGTRLRFLAGVGRTYSILYRLEAGDGPWLKLSDVAAQPAPREVEVVDSQTGSSARFYRLVTPAAP